MAKGSRVAEEEQAREGEVNQSRLGWLPGGGDARPVFIRAVYVSVVYMSRGGGG